MKYAIQTLFIYGWDYTGAEDGERLLFDTEQEAQEDLNEHLLALFAQSFQEGSTPADTDPADWRVVEYNAAHDEITDLQYRASFSSKIRSTSMNYIHNREELVEYIKDRVAEIKEYNPGTWREELHHELFNTDYYIIGKSLAVKWLGDYAFDAIGEIQEYEQENFGEVTTDLSDPERVVNMYTYIAGEHLIGEMVYNSACIGIPRLYDEVQS